MFKAKAMIEDFKLQAIAGMEGAWILWERAILPTLLSGCGAWVGAGKNIYQKLDEIQNEYLRLIYSCPPSTPKPALRSQAGMPNMKHRIWLEKVSLVSSILHTKLDQDNYAREVLNEQIKMGLEGLTTEVKDICHQADILHFSS